MAVETQADLAKEYSKQQGGESQEDLAREYAAQSSAPHSKVNMPDAGTMGVWEPSIWDKIGRALPVLDRIKTGVSQLTTPSSNQEVLQKPLPGMSDQRAVAPEQMMSPMEQKQHPVMTGVGQFAGGMTTPDSMLLQAGMAGPLPSALSRGASALFSMSMLHGAAQEWPELKDAIAQGTQTGDYGEAKRIGTHLMLGAGFGALTGKRAIAGDSMVPMYEQMTKDGREISRLQAQARSKAGIQTSALGLYNSIAQTLQTHIAALTNDALESMRPVIEADKARGGTPINTGSVSAAVEQTKAANGYHPSPAERALLDKVGGQADPRLEAAARDPNWSRNPGPFHRQSPEDQAALMRLVPDAKPSTSGKMTIDELLKLRTDVGYAEVRNKDASGAATMKAAYDAIGDLIRQSTSEIYGNDKPFERYNNQFRAKFDLQKKGMTSDMLENTKRPYSIKADSGAVDKLRNFMDAAGDRKEIKDGMQQLGNKQGQLEMDRHVRDATSLVAANDSVEGKFNKTLARQFLQHPTQAWPGVATALAMYGLPLPMMAKFLVPAVVGAGYANATARMRGGRVGMRLRSELPGEFFEGRPSVLPPEEGGGSQPPQGTTPQSTPPQNTPAPSTPSASPATTTPAGRPVPAEVLKIQQQRGSRGVAPDIGNWQPPPELGAFNAPDYGKTAREKNPEPTRKEVKAAAVKKAKKR